MAFGPSNKKREVDMTSGNIAKLLVDFAVPLLLGNLFQQLYNTVDAWVVGNYVGKEAFSAVGTCSPILAIFISAFIGLANGAGVVVSQYFGKKDQENVRSAAHTAFMTAIIASVLFTVLSALLRDPLMHLMRIPENVYEQAGSYLSIILRFVTFQTLYNMGAAILRGVGDSKRPFYYLVCASFINIGLDLLFVIKLQMGIKGVAYATVIAQGTAALLTVLTLIRSDTSVKISMKYLKIDTGHLKKMLNVGLPTALQLAITSFSNVFMMSYINSFGSDVMGGYTAYNKLDYYMLLPMQSLSMAIATFVGQNLGSGNPDRAKQGVKVCMKIAFGASCIVASILIIFASQAVWLFNKDTVVICYGALFLRLVEPFNAFSPINQICAGALRGAGNSKMAMYTMLGCYVVFRQLFLFSASRLFPGSVVAVMLAFPTSLLLSDIIFAVYYRRHDIAEMKLISNR